MKHPALIGSAFEDAGAPSLYGRVRTSRRTRVFLILSALWLINLFDVGLTMAAYHQGILYEMNPLGEWFLRLGPYSLILFKLAMGYQASVQLSPGHAFNQREIRVPGAVGTIIGSAGDAEGFNDDIPGDDDGTVAA